MRDRATTTFVPDDLDAADWSALGPLYEALGVREAPDREAFRSWLMDRSERVLNRDVRNDVEMFRDENVPLQTELEQARPGVRPACAGAMTVEFEGETRTMPQMARFLESRTGRSASGPGARRRAPAGGPRARSTTIFDEMIALRHEVASNAGFEASRRLRVQSKHRFDYTPTMCFAFHEASRARSCRSCARLDEERRAALGVDELRPWDLAVDVEGASRSARSRAAQDLVREVAARFEPRSTRGSGDVRRRWATGANRAAASRPARSSTSTRARARPRAGTSTCATAAGKPFIFMNAAGLHRDVETMVHEAGHAFHSMLCAGAAAALPQRPIEFAEVASMSDGAAHDAALGRVLPRRGRAARARAEAARGLDEAAPVDRDDRRVPALDLRQPGAHACRAHGVLALARRPLRRTRWSWVGPGTTPAPRRVAAPGAPLRRAVLLHRVRHRAARGAGALAPTRWSEAGRGAIEAYKSALSLGGSRPLPELFEAATAWAAPRRSLCGARCRRGRSRR
jgi:oligoendopeptidase F